VDEPYACDAMVLASMLHALHVFNLYPLPEPAAVEDVMIYQLYKRLEAVAKAIAPLQTRPRRRLMPARPICRHNCTEDNPCDRCCEESSDHSKCSPGPELIGVLQAAHDSASVVLEQWHTGHLDAQAAKTKLPVLADTECRERVAH